MLTNNIDTKGAAYGRALQQLMTGVYISEVCLIGLFAINTSIGPIVLMAVFLVFTALYHALMRHALLPLIRYLPESYDAETSFDHKDAGSYELKHASSPPTETQTLASKGVSAKKAGLLAKFFDPRKFASHQVAKQLVPQYTPPHYEELEEERAYFHPAIMALKPRLWIVRDDLGISQREVAESGRVVDISDEWATFNEKGKVVWTGQEEVQKMPLWEKRIDY